MADNNTSWHVSLIGGLKRRGAWQVSPRMVAVTTVGGVDADLSEAVFESTDSILTKVSLVGGVSLTVPHDVDVTVSGFQLIGGSNIEQAHRTGPAAHTVHVRNYGLFGGVNVNRAD